MRALEDAFTERVMADPAGMLATFLADKRDVGLERLPAVLRPIILSAPEVSRLEAVTRALHHAMAQALKRWAQGAFGETLALPHLLVSRAREEALAGKAFGFTRYDLSIDVGGRVGLLECQAGDPSGMGMQHGLAEVFRRSRAYREEDELEGASTASSLRRLIAPSPRNAGLVVFAIHRDAYVRFDHEVVARLFREEGVDAAAADPDELVYQGGALSWAGRPVKRVVRDAVDDLLDPKHLTASQPLLDAWMADAVMVWNPAGSIVADHKVLLSLLDDDVVLEALNEAERALVRHAVLPTRLLEPEHRAEVLRHRGKLVLKPSDGYGGFGVVVGPLAMPDEWAKAVDDALESRRPHVVQQYAKPMRQVFPVDVEGAVSLQERNIVFSTWMHGDRFGGLFARVHPGGVVNVHQGGGLLPVFVGRS